MWIEMITTVAGARIPTPMQSGHIHEVSEELGQELVACRAAREVAAPKAAGAGRKPQPIETAAENAGQGDGQKAIEGDPDAKPSLIERLTGGAKADASAEETKAEESKSEGPKEPKKPEKPKAKSA